MRYGYGALAAAVCLGSCGADQGQAALCERVLWEVVDAAAPGETRLEQPPPDEPYVIGLSYRARRRDGRPIAGVVRCRFAGGGFGTERFQLVGIWTDDAGELSPFSVAHVKTRLGLD